MVLLLFSSSSSNNGKNMRVVVIVYIGYSIIVIGIKFKWGIIVVDFKVILYGIKVYIF